MTVTPQPDPPLFNDQLVSTAGETVDQTARHAGLLRELIDRTTGA